MFEKIKKFCQNPIYENFKEFEPEDKLFFGILVKLLLKRFDINRAKHEKYEKIYDIFLFEDKNISYDCKRGIKSLIEAIDFSKKMIQNRLFTISVYSKNKKKIIFISNKKFFILDESGKQIFDKNDIKNYILDYYSSNMIEKITFYIRNQTNKYESLFYHYTKGIVFLSGLECYDCYDKNDKKLLEELDDDSLEESLYKLNCETLLKNNCFEKIRYKPENIMQDTNSLRKQLQKIYKENPKTYE